MPEHQHEWEAYKLEFPCSHWRGRALGFVEHWLTWYVGYRCKDCGEAGYRVP